MTSDITKLKYILTLAEELNFSKAAQKLQISQPTLSQHIGKLESELGVTLFDRSSSCIKLTDAGEVYLDGVRTVYDKLMETMDKLSDLEENHISRLSIGTSPNLAHYLLPDIIKEVKQKYPKSIINIYEATTSELTALLENGTVDLTLCVAGDSSQAICNELVYDERIVLAVPKMTEYYEAISNAANDGEINFATVSRLAHFITLQDDQRLTKTLFALSEECNVKPEISVSVTELTTAVEMLKNGLGVMLVPSTFKAYLSTDKELAFFDIEELSDSRSIAVHYRKSKYLSNIGRFFINCLKALDF